MLCGRHAWKSKLGFFVRLSTSDHPRGRPGGPTLPRCREHRVCLGLKV